LGYKCRAEHYQDGTYYSNAVGLARNEISAGTPKPGDKVGDGASRPKAARGVTTAGTKGTVRSARAKVRDATKLTIATGGSIIIGRASHVVSVKNRGQPRKPSKNQRTTFCYQCHP
jgi:hypothetical protein